ncbi:hypothetical protein [Pseudonocardia sp. NPDC049635]|uniref:zinc finger domain-containing protein n=1 Tax=Pseudonocardia sp. NPDC049635 TaxID=3155506 RepID=UPI0033C31DE1
MTAQLQLDVAGRRAAPIEARLLRELDHFRQHPPAPDDTENVRAHRDLIAGHELLLDWLGTVDPLPDDPLRWPCSACWAAPGTPCDVPGTRSKWTPPGPRFHLDRGTAGRWGGVVDRAEPGGGRC